MRLWHQSLTEVDRLPAYADAMQDHFRKVGSTDTSVDLHGMDPGTYPSRYPGEDIRYLGAQAFHSVQILRNVVQAEAEGYDAFLLMTLPEPVLEECRSLVDIPVVGYGQSAMYLANMLGRRFAVFAMITELVPLYEDNMKKHGMGGRGNLVVPFSLPFDSVVAGFEDPTEVVGEVSRLAGELAKEGIDVIIPGEAPVAAVLAQAGLTRVGEVPIVDGLGATLQFAEMMVRLRERSGQQVSRTSYYTWRPPSERIAEIMRFYGVAGRYSAEQQSEWDS